ncbi:MAG: pseudouridine synthase [Spirochaetota bacterium]
MTHRLLALNKPKGYVVTRSDELNRKTVYELLPEWANTDDWMPIGRLDMDSKGLLLFTRDGTLADRLTTPGNCEKVYEIWVRGHVNDEHIRAALAGVETPEGLLKAVRVERKGGAGPKTRLEVELDEGKNRHIRRLFGAMTDAERGTPLKVLELKRVQIGCIKLDLPSGKWRFLSDDEESILLSGG